MNQLIKKGGRTSGVLVQINAIKTVEMIIDFRRSLEPLTLMVSTTKTGTTVKTLRFFGVIITKNLKQKIAQEVQHGNL